MVLLYNSFAIWCESKVTFCGLKWVYSHQSPHSLQHLRRTRRGKFNDWWLPLRQLVLNGCMMESLCEAKKPSILCANIECQEFWIILFDAEFQCWLFISFPSFLCSALFMIVFVWVDERRSQLSSFDLVQWKTVSQEGNTSWTGTGNKLYLK